jgi:orotate phosphoribosyltransferase
MGIISIDNKYRSELINLVIENNAFFPSKSQESLFPIAQGTNVLFELDRLWSNHKSLIRTVNLLVEVISKCNINYSTIVGLTSRAGAFGTVPFCTGISIKAKKNLLIFDEEKFNNYNIHPDGDYCEKLKGEKLLLLKDVILRGDSLLRAMDTIKLIGAELNGIIILADLNIQKNSIPRYNNIQNKVPIIILLDGPFPELEKIIDEI